MLDDKQKKINALYEYEINRRVWLHMVGFHEAYDITWFWTIDENCKKI